MERGGDESRNASVLSSARPTDRVCGCVCARHSPAKRATLVCLESNGHRASPLISSPSNSRLSSCRETQQSPPHYTPIVLGRIQTHVHSASWCLDTDPVVPAHRVEAVGPADEDEVVVSGHQHFDEVMALVLERRHRDTMSS